MHLTSLDFALLRSGQASEEKAASLRRHLLTCTECAALARNEPSLMSAAVALQAAFAEAAEEHSSEDDLAAFADGSLSASRREEVAAHVDRCAGCRDEVNDLSAWIRTSAPRRRGWPAWIAAAAAAIAIAFLLLQPSGRTTERPDAPSRPKTRVQLPASTPAVRVPEQRAPEWDALMTEVRRTGVLPVPEEIRELAASDSYRGESHEGREGGVWPAATAIDEQRPAFRWQAIPGARYSILLVEQDGREVASSPTLAKPQWTSDVVLERGKTYRWQVTAMTKGETLILPTPPAPPAIFRVLSEAAHAELANAKRLAPDDHLLLGVLHARNGVVDTARRELASVRGSADEGLAKRLLRQMP